MSNRPSLAGPDRYDPVSPQFGSPGAVPRIVLALNVLGGGIRDILDPRLRGAV